MAERAGGIYNPDDDPWWDDENCYEDPLPRVEVRQRPGRRWRIPWMKTFAAAACIAGLSFYALHAPQTSKGSQSLAVAADATVLRAPEPEWTSAQSGALFKIDAADLVFPPVIQETRLHRSGGREDTLSMGEFATAPHFKIAISRQVPDDAGRSFYVDLVLKAAESSLAVERNAQPTVVTTKFGALEVSETVLHGRANADCLAFRHKQIEPPFALRGWLCAAEGKTVDSRLLACLVERVTLADPGKAPELASLFTENGRQKGGACAGIKRPNSQVSHRM